MVDQGPVIDHLVVVDINSHRVPEVNHVLDSNINLNLFGKHFVLTFLAIYEDGV